MSKITYEQVLRYAEEVGAVHSMRPAEVAEFANMHAVMTLTNSLTVAEYVGSLLTMMELAGQVWESMEYDTGEGVLRIVFKEHPYATAMVEFAVNTEE